MTCSDRARQRRVVDAFLAAARGGDLADPERLRELDLVALDGS